MVEGGFEFAQRGLVLVLSAEDRNDFDGASETGEGTDFQHVHILDGFDAFVGVLFQKEVEHFAGLRTVFLKYVALLGFVRALLPRQRRAVVRQVTDHIEGVVILPDFLPEVFEEHPFVFERRNDRELAVYVVPFVQELVEAGV